MDDANIVHIDADEEPYADRTNPLDQRLREGGNTGVGATDLDVTATEEEVPGVRI